MTVGCSGSGPELGVLGEGSGEVLGDALPPPDGPGLGEEVRAAGAVGWGAALGMSRRPVGYGHGRIPAPLSRAEQSEERAIGPWRAHVFVVPWAAEESRR